MSWYNTYDGDGDGLTRVVTTKLDLTEMPLSRWTNKELSFRLAVIYPQVDGYEHLTASDEVKAEVEALKTELTERGFDWSSNLRFNERCTGWGWLPGLTPLAARPRSTV